MDRDDLEQDARLRRALTPPGRVAERIVSKALSRAVARPSRFAAASRPRARLFAFGWGATVGAGGLALGVWLAARALAAPTLLIANHGDVFALRDARGATHVLGREARSEDRRDEGIVGSGALVLVLQGGAR